MLLALCQAAEQGRVRLEQGVWGRLRHLVERWHNMVRSTRVPDIPAATNRSGALGSRFNPRARLAQGLKTEAGTLNFVHPMARSRA